MSWLRVGVTSSALVGVVGTMLANRAGHPMQNTMSYREALAEAWPGHEGRLGAALLGTLTLGLAPYYPHAHVWKQLVNLAHGTLTEPIDIFDLVLHGTPWLALFAFLAHFLRDGARRAGVDRVKQR